MCHQNVQLLYFQEIYLFYKIAHVIAHTHTTLLSVFCDNLSLIGEKEMRFKYSNLFLVKLLLLY